MENQTTQSTFRVGILQCDEVRESFRADHGDYDEMLVRGLRRADPALTYQVFRVFENELPEDVRVCDGWITSGSRYSVNDENDWTAALCRFVQALGVESRPYVGICYGMQMMARRSLGRFSWLSPAGVSVWQPVIFRKLSPGWFLWVMWCGYWSVIKSR